MINCTRVESRARTATWTTEQSLERMPDDKIMAGLYCMDEALNKVPAAAHFYACPRAAEFKNALKDPMEMN